MMKKSIYIILLISQTTIAQTLTQKLNSSIQKVLQSEGGKSAQISMTVADKKGNIIYDYNGNIGLSTASTQKIFTAAMALETLGKDYQYTTTASYSGKIENGVLSGNIYISSNGDPTLGSWRYDGYKPEDFKSQFISSIQALGVQEIKGDIIIDDTYFDFQNNPGGWPWDDIGNYYGAGVWGVNWRENQFDLKIKGNKILSTNIELPNVKWISQITEMGNSDKSIIFTAPHSEVAFINGALPAEKTMTVSGATPNPPLTFANEIKNTLIEHHFKFNGNILSIYSEKIKGKSVNIPQDSQLFLSYSSPTLDKIVYWFLRKSVNLYGETLVKTMAKNKKKGNDFKAGIEHLQSFWASKGIKKHMINFADGSGLSPQNYVSSKAEVQALVWAYQQPWFSTFHEGLPTINGMKMKSGTMRNTKSFAGYHNGYIFSIIINNYQSPQMSEALFSILNPLK